MVDADMVKEVKDLLSEGYTEDKVVANLVKIGFSEKEAGEILAEAQKGMEPVAPAPKAMQPEPEAAKQPVLEPMAQPEPTKAEQPKPAPVAQPEEGLPGMSFEEEMPEEDEADLLLAAGGMGGEPAEPVELPDVGGAPAPPKEAEPPKEEHAHNRRHHRKAEPTPPKVMQGEGEEPEEKPKTGAGKAILIFLVAFIVIMVLAYFIAFPKLGITLF